MRVPKAPSVHRNTPVRVLIQNAKGLNIDSMPDGLAYEVLLPLGKDQLQGGRSAHDALGGQLLQALKPYMKAGVRDREPAECFTLLRCAARGMHLLQHVSWNGSQSCWLLQFYPLLQGRSHVPCHRTSAVQAHCCSIALFPSNSRDVLLQQSNPSMCLLL